MKKIALFRFASIIVAFAALATSCEKEPVAEPNAEVLPTLVGKSITVPAVGESIKFQVDAADNWVASTDAPWILISPANGTGRTTCSIIIDSTLLDVTRTNTVRITDTATNESGKITINQDGFARAIEINSDKNIALPNYADQDKRFFNVDLTTNVEFVVTDKPSWIDEVEIEKYSLDRDARPRKVKVKVNYNIHTNPTAERSAVLKIRAKHSDKYENIEVELPVSQAAGDLIPNSVKGDSMAIVAIARNINSYFVLDNSEPLRNWENVTLWEVTDPDLDSYLDDRNKDEEYKDFTREELKKEVLGRVKRLSFFIFNTEEAFPYEIRYLKHCVDLEFKSNENHDLKRVDFGESIGELIQLKRLNIFAAGVYKFDDSLLKLKRLESLYLDQNLFGRIPDEINPDNYPRLKHLSFMHNIIHDYNNLAEVASSTAEGELGMEMSADDMKRLFEWEKLETLILGNNYFYGELPSMDYMPCYTQAQIDENKENEGATILTSIPRVLPNCKFLVLNLNRFTGKIPDWILYHPNLLYFDPYTLIFNQGANSRNRQGELCRFTNEPESFQYYYDQFPYWAKEMGSITGDDIVTDQITQ